MPWNDHALISDDGTRVTLLESRRGRTRWPTARRIIEHVQVLRGSLKARPRICGVAVRLIIDGLLPCWRQLRPSHLAVHGRQRGGAAGDVPRACDDGDGVGEVAAIETG